MAKRAKVIIPFNYDEGWTGGNYYVANLVSSLSYLPADRQPDIFVLSHNQNSYDFIVKSSNYQRTKWISSLMIGGIDGGNFRRLRLMSKLLPRFLKAKLDFDAIFPFPIDTKERAKTICWIPDFQERALPHLFSNEELQYRKTQHLYYIENFDNILFSSHAALSDFKEYYPQAKNRTHVMQFAVAEVPNGTGMNEVLTRFELPSQFFYCPNQFWLHKNHEVVIDAVDLLASQGITVTVAFSGKELDRRDPEHVIKLKRRVADLGLSRQIKFLGFIAKDDQYALINGALALVQPSLFEGWSTVVEEAKSKSQFVIASDLPVHREQLSENVTFFDPKDKADLASAMKARLENMSANVKLDYDLNRRAFADNFLKIIHSLKMERTDG
jgi:glycosyltransferase involved in cell wall biosynthesis